MPKHAAYAPKHRNHAKSRTIAVHAPKKALRTSLLLSSLAVSATGAAVAGGVATQEPDRATTVSADLGPAATTGSDDAGTSAASAPEASAAETPASPEAAPTSEAPAGAAGEREQLVSRSDRRAAADPAKEAALSQESGRAMTRTEDLSDADPRTAARAMLPEFGFSSDQFGCLDSLWTKESNWTVDADNPTSSAYGIPQALPGSKMASAGSDWATNPVTQIRWGLGYIEDRYGSPCSAWAHSQSHNWY
ncbi:lytic transglycosylase domain-containing protein [Nocardioides pantholopis]|uniref:aggregation-promoting factor C-terminal-like domain-containing protein n=1 Tax=Nocardioides pantholopis TaxID=2483798 RepID=UPI000FD7BE14|nr:lytic transglycosylase domain-containing protein [Nocardioides pantholopis]